MGLHGWIGFAVCLSPFNPCAAFTCSARASTGDELQKAEADPSVIALMEKPLDVYMFRQLLDL